MGYKLFDYMVEQHDLTLLESELAEIVHHVHKEHGYDQLKKAVKEMREVQERYFQHKIRKMDPAQKQRLLVLSKEKEKIVDELISDKLF